MIKKIAVAVSAAAIATAGFAAFGAGTATAAGEDIDCTSVKAKVTLNPALTMTPGFTTTSINGKLKTCTTPAGLPAGASVKGGTVTGQILPGAEPGTCDIGTLAGPSEQDITINITWKVKKGTLGATGIVFTNRDGFTLPGSTGTSNVTGTSSGKQIKIVGNATGDVPKIIKKCYGKDGVAAAPHGKGVTKIKVASGTYTTT